MLSAALLLVLQGKTLYVAASPGSSYNCEFAFCLLCWVTQHIINTLQCLKLGSCLLQTKHDWAGVSTAGGQKARGQPNMLLSIATVPAALCTRVCCAHLLSRWKLSLHVCC